MPFLAYCSRDVRQGYLHDRAAHPADLQERILEWGGDLQSPFFVVIDEAVLLRDIGIAKLCQLSST
jgi:hypothetical protein